MLNRERTLEPRQDWSACLPSRQAEFIPLTRSLERLRLAAIVAGRANFPERDCVRSTSRSASKLPRVLVLLQSVGSCLPAAAGPADTARLFPWALPGLLRVRPLASRGPTLVKCPISGVRRFVADLTGKQARYRCGWPGGSVIRGGGGFVVLVLNAERNSQ